jgi:hypothetical protein
VPPRKRPAKQPTFDCKKAAAAWKKAHDEKKRATPAVKKAESLALAERGVATSRRKTCRAT